MFPIFIFAKATWEAGGSPELSHSPTLRSFPPADTVAAHPILPAATSSGKGAGCGQRWLSAQGAFRAALLLTAPHPLSGGPGAACQPPAPSSATPTRETRAAPCFVSPAGTSSLSVASP